jgi:adenylylsulfate kinase
MINDKITEPKKTGFTFWLTGRSGAGKTTLGEGMLDHLRRQGYKVQLLDGDFIRDFVSNPDFSKEGRERHLMYVGLAAKLLNDHGINTICTFVSPYEEIRLKLRMAIPNFRMIYVKCSLDETRRRDVKGLYAKKTAGIETFEEPVISELTVDTESESVSESLTNIKQYLNRELHVTDDATIPEEIWARSW